jgi:ABC-type oligopeptide transport system ATPase subunit
MSLKLFHTWKEDFKNEIESKGADSDYRDHLEYFRLKNRIRNSGYHIFLLGGTGSGKSTCANTLCGHNLVKTGVLRPTTSRVQVITGTDSKDFPDDVDVIPCSSLPSDISIWDFPDFDSFETSHHHYSILFREYADVLLVITHPEKTAQDGLFELTQRYPKLYQEFWITHKEEIPEPELSLVKQQFGNQIVFFFDSLKFPQEMKEHFDGLILMIRERGERLLKEQLSNIRNELFPVSNEVSLLIEKEQTHLSENKECWLERLNTAQDTYARETLKCGIELLVPHWRKKLQGKLLFSQLSWYSLLHSRILGFFKPQMQELELSSAAGSLYHVLSGELGEYSIFLPDSSQFRDYHGRVVAKLDREMEHKTLHQPLFFKAVDLCSDFILLPGLCFFVCYRFILGPFPWLALVFSLSLLLLFYLFFWIRYETRLKSLMKSGLQLYVEQMGAFCNDMKNSGSLQFKERQEFIEQQKQFLL